MRFETATEYLKALQPDPSLAVIPVALAAEALQLVRSSVERMLKDGRLTQIHISTVRCVRASDVIKIINVKQSQEAHVRKRLEAIARKRKPAVSYEPVMTPIHLDKTLSHHRARIGIILGDISQTSHEQHGILLSVLVHKKSRGGLSLPSEGFFRLASGLGYVWKDKAQFVKEQMERVYKHYAKE